jgi:hypothetical protein
MKRHPVETELYHADRYEKANSHVSQYANLQNNESAQRN